MASQGAVSGIAVASVGAGVLLLYTGIRGKDLLSEVQALAAGKSAGTAKPANQISGSASGGGGSGGGGGGGPVPNTGSAQQALQQAAASRGWGSGAEWQALQSVEMAEAGFNPRARNPQSGAFGLAQALGHGTANTAAPDGTNEYGGFGLTDAQARAANSGQPGPQAAWMCNYIAATYGDPAAAWAHEQANHWY